MPYPKNPENIVIKEFYSSALTEIKIWNHYQKYKDDILEQNKNRNSMLFIKLESGELIVRKKWKGNPIRLTKSNYDEIISGRSISVHSLMRDHEDIAIIDIDSNNFKNNKEAAKAVYTILTFKETFIKKCKIRYTGKTGFHIYCLLNKKMEINSIRTVLKKLLSSDTKITDKYTIQTKRSEGTPNIDLYSNKLDGGFICSNSLSVIGLKCTELKYNEVDSFTFKKACI